MLRHVFRQYMSITPKRAYNAVKPQNAMRPDFHIEYDAKLEEQTLQLSDGRTMGFAEYGDRRGIPAMLLHGSPGCRYDGECYHQIAKKLNVHVVCPDRPGYGFSSIKPGQKLGEYAHDIAELATHLNLRQYHVFGVSGGGPYAIACAHRLPKHEILSSSVIAGMGAPQVLTIKDDGLRTVIVLLMCKWTPGLMRSLVRYGIANEERMAKSWKRWAKYLVKSEEDLTRILDPKFIADTVAFLKVAHCQDGAGGIRDGEIYYGPWDFELKDVQMKVNLFFGLKDTNAKPAAGRYYRDHLPNAELIEFENMSHFNMESYDEEILSRIIGAWKPNGPPTTTTTI